MPDLQSAIGNQAVLRLMRARQASSQPRPSVAPAGLPDTAQAKLKIGAANDPLEHEADRVADHVVRMPSPDDTRTVALPRITQKCEACDEQEELQMKRDIADEASLATVPASVRETLHSAGQPLDAATRAYFEPRFGQDFGNVRIHSDRLAAESAHTLNAVAYTAGQHVVFGTGAYNPMSNAGRKLLAHELTHIVQRASGLRRMTLGQGHSPEELQAVPDEERDRVLAAIARVQTIAYDTDYAACQNAFAETCPNGDPSSLRKAFDEAILWRFPHGSHLGAGATTFCGTPNIGYTDTGYQRGEVSLAYDLLHELGHICGIACPDLPHYLADKLALYCMGPREHDESHRLTLTVGRSLEDWQLILSYGWLLREWRGGRLSLNLDVDFNVLGLLHTLQGNPSEIGGTTLDFLLRPFSGEHFGGLSFHGGIGGQFGRFRVRPPADGDPQEIRSGGALVLEVGSRIEWWVKDEEAVDNEGIPGRVKPRTFDFSYRLIQPATSDAKRIHEFLASYILYF